MNKNLICSRIKVTKLKQEKYDENMKYVSSFRYN